MLRPGGLWVAWWSHAWADGQIWFDTYQEVMEAACPGYRRHHRDPDWSEESIASTGRFQPGLLIVVPWTRQVEVGTWIAEERSKSYIAQLTTPVRNRLLGRIQELLGTHFSGVPMIVPYQTRMWLARRR